MGAILRGSRSGRGRIRNVMTSAVAIIVEYQTPDLLELCLASLKRFAPDITPLVVHGGHGAEAHAAGIEAARRNRWVDDAKIVILLDTDVFIWSARWIWWVEWWLSPLQGGMEAVGGLRHRGDVTQIYQKGHLLLHAHCLAMTRSLFERVRTFHATGPTLDTAWQVTMEAKHTRGLIPWADGRAAVYREDEDLSRAPLWAHLGRGTSFRPRGLWRERVRRMAASVGSPRAQKILSYQRDRAAFLRKGWMIVRA